MREMKRRYGEERGERIFYATANKLGLTPGGRRGTIKVGADRSARRRGYSRP